MTPELQQRVGQVFDQALSIEAGQRAAFVAEACQDDPPDVRSEVESLLAHFEHAAAADFLKEPLANVFERSEMVKGGESLREETLPAPPGYEILNELGRGGMGIVYKARQFRLNRFVALKKILDSSYADEKDLVRFLGEAEMVARMQHPNIVQIHEVGSHNGQPFFSMEYVEGGSLAEKLNGTPLPYRQAAELVQTLAQAVQAAHDAGIIHRDLKPANVLMTAAGVPKVMDFGLAKSLSCDPGLTESGAILGTPSYMAPEQAWSRSNSLGPACDVYALGVILYELLTGRPPFQAETAMETIQLVLHQEPVPPRRLQPKVPSDLETICLKCLSKDAGKRYPSAAALAEDLRRTLAGEPILARPVGKVERIARWCRRNPWISGLLAALLFVFVGGVVGVTGQWIRAEKGWTKAEHERDRAEMEFRDHHHSVAEFYKLATEDDQMFEPAFQSVAKKWREAALTYFQHFLEQRGEDPQLRAEVAKAHFRIAQMNDANGSRLEALSAYEQAALQFEKLCADHPTERNYPLKLALTYQNRGILLSQTKDRQRALSCFDQAQQLFQGLIERNQDDTDAQHGLSETLLSKARVQTDSRQFSEALALVRQAVRILEMLLDAHPDSIPFRYELATGYVQLGNLCHLLKEPKALESFQKAQKLLAELAHSNPNRPRFQAELAKVQYGMGLVYIQMGQEVRALSCWIEAMKMQEKLVRSYPTFTDFQRDLAASYVILGDLRKDLELAQKARTIAAQLVKKHGEQIEYQLLLARSCYISAVLQTKKDPKSARQTFDQAKDLLEPVDALDVFHLEVLVGCYMELSGGIGETLPLNATVSLMRKAQIALKKLIHIDPENPKYHNGSSLIAFRLGQTYERHRHPEEALSAYRDAIEPARTALKLCRPGSDQWKYHRQFLSDCLMVQAKTQRDQKLPAEAVATCLQRKELWAGDAAALVRVARDIALCVPLVGQGQTELQTDQKAKRDHYAGQAVAVLTEAIGRGYRNVRQLEAAPELQPLRSREDFQKLLAQLKANQNREVK